MTTAMAPRRVVITGIGMVTPVGLDTAATWKALLAGTSGVGEITAFDTSDFSVHIAGEVKGLDPAAWMDKRDARKYDRFVHFAMAASKQAVRHGGLDLEALDRTRCGCVIASGVGGILSTEEQMRRYQAKGPGRVSPLTIPKIMVNSACGLVAIDLGFQGVNYSPVTACASGSHAVGLAMRHVQWGEADVMLAGGSEAGISILGLGGFSNMSALSTRNDDPERASRPFDKDRDGFVMGEGAGVVVLEELEHARARGATLYAEVLGYGFTDDAFHITSPAEGGEGGARAIRVALENSGRGADEVDYINAHGTSTPYNDRNETAAIKEALGERARTVKINSTKSMTGHMLGAAGGVEAGVVALSIHEQRIHPTINYTTPDPDCDLDYTPNEGTELPIRVALSNSLGFGGHNATVAFGRVED
jgi:3-oxoacyl-[acyl-carrier-protein] synthase II